MPRFLLGEAGSQRLAWDVLEQPGATDLIVHIGSNDLRLGVPRESMIQGFQQVVAQTRKRYQKIFGTTILPGGYPPEHEGSQYFDAVFDFATPLHSPEDEARLNPAYDSGDGIHPNDEGYQLMAAAVDITQLTGSPDQ